MKKRLVWLETEYKRAAFMLPFILKRAIILTIVCLTTVGMIAFCTKLLQNTDSEAQKLRIGYVAEENLLTDIAVSYVQSMESIQSLCSLEAVTEQEGRQLMEEGKLAALIVLPEDVVNEILSGKNAPAKLYLPSDSGGTVAGGFYAIGSILFEELASAGMGMLGTAQAEIYATAEIFAELTAEYDGDGEAIGKEFFQTMYDEINRFNLGVVTKREDLFRTKNLSVTGNDTYAVYYGSALLTIYTMLAGLFFGSFCKRSSLYQTMTAKRIGVGYAMQFTASFLAGSMLRLLVTLFPLVMLLFLQIKGLLSVPLTVSGIVCLILVILFMTVYDLFWYQMVEKQESALVVIGIAALLQAYASGCLIPSVLLPEIINKVGTFLPAAFIKTGFTLFLTGETEGLARMAAGLLTWGLILCAVTLWRMYAGEQHRTNAEDNRVDTKLRVPSIGLVLLRRLLHRKSIWVCMGFVALLSGVITRTEKNSEIQIKAAVYDESGDYGQLLSDYDGLVRFEVFDSSKQVERAVQTGEAECGYILPKDLTEKMIVRSANQSVTVCQDADTVAAPVVNEILFEQIFERVSLKWYQHYIAQSSVAAQFDIDTDMLQTIVSDSFEKQLTSGATFDFEIVRIGPESESAVQKEENETTYPVYMVAAVTILLCVLQGAVQVIADIRERCFYKRNQVLMAVMTMILPVLLGIFTASAVFLLTL